MYRGYIYISLAGTYTFTMPGADDLAWFWLGDLAKAGWTKANANKAPFSTVTFTAPIEGTYIPIRIVAANNGYNAMSWSLTMTSPYNQNYPIGTLSTTSNNLLRFSCDGTTAPAFSNAIGQEDSGPNAYVAAPTPCDNTGLEYGAFVHNQYASGTLFSSFNPGFMKATAAGGVGPARPTVTSNAQ